jgi:glycosyltransferase involved in cell wall biosynthesis
MKISIGIMLWNEESTIEMTLDSLFQQSIFRDNSPSIESIEVVVLANGCTDQSIPNAKRGIMKNLESLKNSKVSARVEGLPKGRSPAWNKFVHELTAGDVDYIVFMDADISINNQNAIWSMVDGLARSEYHPVAGALGIKDIDLNSRKTLLQQVASSMTKMEHDARFFYLCGGLYCGKSSFFRRFEFPDGFICGDDAFIANLAITNFMTTDYQFDRILHPADAKFVFEAYSTVSRLFKQNRRRMIGARVRTIIQDFVRANQIDRYPDAGTVIRDACRKDPSWLINLTETTIAESGFWVVPMKTALYRVNQLRHVSWGKKIARVPLAIAGTIWQISIIISANRVFRRREHLGAWTNMQNTRMKTLAIHTTEVIPPDTL